MPRVRLVVRTPSTWMVRIWPQSLQDILNILQNADRKARQRYLRIEATSGPARLDLGSIVLKGVKFGLPDSRQLKIQA